MFVVTNNSDVFDNNFCSRPAASKVLTEFFKDIYPPSYILSTFCFCVIMAASIVLTRSLTPALFSLFLLTVGCINFYGGRSSS